SLLEVLVTANLDFHKGLSPKLLQRERAIQDSLAAQAQEQMNMLAKGADENALNQAEAETRKLTTEYQELQAEISEQGLRNAVLEQPNPLRLPDIQQQLLDGDTVLLEYFLGEETSYVWAVTRSSLHSYKLGSRTELE